MVYVMLIWAGVFLSFQSFSVRKFVCFYSREEINYSQSTCYEPVR